MGLLDLFKAPQRQEPPPELPAGSFTIDRDGTILATTISSRFPRENLQLIAALVLQTFADARKADLSLSEISVRFAALNIRAVEMRGGAMIFLSPRGERSHRIQTSP